MSAPVKRALVRVVAVGDKWALLLTRNGELLDTYEDRTYADAAASLINDQPDEDDDQ